MGGVGVWRALLDAGAAVAGVLMRGNMCGHRTDDAAATVRSMLVRSRSAIVLRFINNMC